MRKYGLKNSGYFVQQFIRLTFFINNIAVLFYLASSQEYAGKVGVISRREIRPFNNSHKTRGLRTCRALTFKLIFSLGRQQLT